MPCDVRRSRNCPSLSDAVSYARTARSADTCLLFRMRSRHDPKTRGDAEGKVRVSRDRWLSVLGRVSHLESGAGEGRMLEALRGL